MDSCGITVTFCGCKAHIICCDEQKNHRSPSKIQFGVNVRPIAFTHKRGQGNGRGRDGSK